MNMKILKYHASAHEKWKPYSNITVGTKKIVAISNSCQMKQHYICQFLVQYCKFLNICLYFASKSVMIHWHLLEMDMKTLKYLLSAIQTWKPNSNISLGSQKIISVLSLFHFNMLTFVNSNCVAVKHSYITVKIWGRFSDIHCTWIWKP